MKKVIKKCMECGCEIVNKETNGFMVVYRRCEACRAKFEGVIDYEN